MLSSEFLPRQGNFAGISCEYKNIYPTEHFTPTTSRLSNLLLQRVSGFRYSRVWKMRWKQRYNYVRPARPKARCMKAEETGQILARLNGAVEHSPVLRALGVQARHLRGRFYLDWRWEPVDRPEEVSTYGRLTPLAQVAGNLLLEVPYG